VGKEKDRESKLRKSGAKEELEVFVPMPKKIKTLDGQEIEVPKTTWKNEIQIGRIISKGVSDIPALKEINFKEIKIADMVSLLPTIIDVAPDVITGVTSILLKKEKEWIENNLNGEIIIGLLSPFFGNFLNKVLKKVDISKLTKLTEKVPLPK